MGIHKQFALAIIFPRPACVIWKPGLYLNMCVTLKMVPV